MKIKNGIKIKDFPLVSTDEKNLNLKTIWAKTLYYIFILKISLQDALQKV